MQSDITREKSAFVVAFLASVIAINEFEEFLVKINLNLGFDNYSALDLGKFFIALLMCATYFYGFEFARYCLPKKFQNVSWFKWIVYLGNFFYLGAITLPIWVIFLVIIIKIISVISPLAPALKESALALAGYAFISLIAPALFYFNKNLTKRVLELRSKSLDEELYLQTVSVLFAGKFYPAAAVEARKVAEAILRYRLEKEGFITTGRSLSELIQLSEKAKLLSEEEKGVFERIRLLGNKAAHPGNKTTRSDVGKMIRELEKIQESKSIEEKVNNKAMRALKYASGALGVAITAALLKEIGSLETLRTFLSQ